MRARRSVPSSRNGGRYGKGSEQRHAGHGASDGAHVDSVSHGKKLTEVARYRVLFDDCDPMRIMYYGSYFRLLEIGWTELLRRLGVPVPVYIARGLHVAVTEVTCRYVQPARYDDLLVVRAGLMRVEPTCFEVHHEVLGPSGVVLVTGKTLHAVLDHAGRLQRVPEELMHAARARTS